MYRALERSRRSVAGTYRKAPGLDAVDPASELQTPGEDFCDQFGTVRNVKYLILLAQFGPREMTEGEDQK